MKKIVAQLSYHGFYRVSFDDSVEINPYTVDYFWQDGKDLKVKTLERYADLRSAMFYLAQIIE